MPLIGSTAESITSAIAKGLVRGVTVRSQVTPDFFYDPWAPASTEPPNPFMKALLDFAKPSVTIETANGPVTFEPSGPPVENKIPIVAVGGLALVVGIVTLIGAVARWTR